MDRRLAEEVANMYADIQDAYRDLLADLRDDAVGIPEFEEKVGRLKRDLVRLKSRRLQLVASKVRHARPNAVHRSSPRAPRKP